MTDGSRPVFSTTPDSTAAADHLADARNSPIEATVLLPGSRSSNRSACDLGSPCIARE